MAGWWRSVQIAFTFIGTVVGAGFASGREVMQFFTRFGHWGPVLILLATAIFVWVGAKMMLLSARIRASSYEDLNKYLFGERLGRIASHFMLVILLAVNAVMLAGAGAVFSEHLHLNFQFGLLVTMLACFLLLRKGMSAIVAVNTVIAPLMIMFSIYLLVHTVPEPDSGPFAAANTASPLATGMSPFLYAAFNLSLAQAVLVPLGSAIGDSQTLRRGAWLGGIGIGLLLLASHFTLSSRLPDITGLNIPMARIAEQFGIWVHGLYILLIYSEIFTTLISDLYGMIRQLQQHTRLHDNVLAAGLLLLCFAIGQFGFGKLLSTLYPLFGLLSLGWLYLICQDRLLRRDLPPPSAPNA
jgi:uncharacterized membrane protein YkvI